MDRASSNAVYPGEFDLTFEVPRKEVQYGRKLSDTLSIFRRLPRFPWRRETQVSMLSGDEAAVGDGTSENAQSSTPGGGTCGDPVKEEEGREEEELLAV